MRTIARRSLLIGSAAIAGGVAFGVYFVRRPHPNPLLRSLGAGEATFNPWVKVSAERITLIAPHTDFGQGARSIQAALIAEEMDLELGQFVVEAGEPSAAYWNTAGADEAVAFLRTDRSLPARAMRGIMTVAARVAGIQATGGSSTVEDSFEKLRRAGAVARETLKLAAAMRTGVPVAQLSTQGAAVRLPDGSSIPYTDLAADAAALEPVTDVALRAPSQWRLLGTDMRRIDIVAKSTGTAKYGIDRSLERMVFATVRINPRRGPMLGYDASAARKMPGVQEILEVTNGVAVVADNTWNAFRAAESIEFDWGPAPYPAEMAEHWGELEASFVDSRLGAEWLHSGDVPGALARAQSPIDAEYRAPYLAHAPLEPLSAVTVVTDARVDIWVAHQFPQFAEELVAGITGVDREQVHLHNEYCGGSFGHRLEFENVRYAAEIAAQLKGTPVKLTYSREEDFRHDFVRQIGMCRVSGVVADGGVESLDIAVAAPPVLRSQLSRTPLPSVGADVQLPAGIWSAPYAIPNFRVRTYEVPGLAPTSSWRSVGASTGGFFIECAMDELIRAAGADPLEERLRLCADERARRVLETVGEMCDWGADIGPDRGRGLALVVSFGVPCAEVVEVTQTPRGIRIDKVWVAAEVGRILDPVNFENQVQGAVVWGLGHAMNCEITYSDGAVQQTNYHRFEGMRMHQCPLIEVRGIELGGEISGIGEPPVPPAAPALANAIFAATGRRIREMPFARVVDFV